MQPHLEAPISRKRNGGVGQLQCLSGRPDDRGQDGVGGECGFQAFPEARDHAVRFVPLAIHQAVDVALEPIAQRLEEDRYDAGGDEGDRQVAAGLENGAEVADDEDVDGDDDGGQGEVDQGSVDDQVYVVEAVAQYRYADGGRDGEDAEAQNAPVVVQGRKHCGHTG